MADRPDKNAGPSSGDSSDLLASKDKSARSGIGPGTGPGNGPGIPDPPAPPPPPSPGQDDTGVSKGLLEDTTPVKGDPNAGVGARDLLSQDGLKKQRAAAHAAARSAPRMPEPPAGPVGGTARPAPPLADRGLRVPHSLVLQTPPPRRTLMTS